MVPGDTALPRPDGRGAQFERAARHARLWLTIDADRPHHVAEMVDAVERIRATAPGPAVEPLLRALLDRLDRGGAPVGSEPAMLHNQVYHCSIQTMIHGAEAP